MRRMDSDGPIDGTYEDGLSIIPGVGKNSPSYDLPYDVSMCGK